VIEAMVAAGTESAAPSKVSLKKKGKKRKISKHIADSVVNSKNAISSRDTGAGEQLEIANDPTSLTATKTTSAPTQKRRKIASHVKDPAEAAAYLTAWQSKSGWKFNKNTQSWLIRHMYSDKLSKATFATLLAYLDAAGDSIKQRVIDDATSRAVRYQTTSNHAKGESTETASISTANFRTSAMLASDAEAIEEAKDWEQLSEHDKRKEYKRARKLLDTLKVTNA
jgi:WKF domain